MAGVEEEGAPGEQQQPQLSSASAGGPEDVQPAALAESPEDTEPAAPSKSPTDSEPAVPSESPSPADTQPAAPSESPGPGDTQPAAPTESPGPGDTQPAAPTEGTEERAAVVGASRRRHTDISVETSVEQFRLRKFFVLRPGTLNQAIKDIEALVDEEIDGSVHSVWLMAEVDHWNNEKERVVLITDNSLLVFKYDFVMFRCEQIQRIPLNIVDRISHGEFTFPQRSLLSREGEGLRVFWDRLREPSFTSRWNPFTMDYPFITFTYHPVGNVSDSFAALCDIHKFREQLKDAAQRFHALKPFPGKANGVLVLTKPILIEAYVGLMSFIGNTNKLGYCMARGNLGF